MPICKELILIVATTHILVILSLLVSSEYILIVDFTVHLSSNDHPEMGDLISQLLDFKNLRFKVV